MMRLAVLVLLIAEFGFSSAKIGKLAANHSKSVGEEFDHAKLKNLEDIYKLQVTKLRKQIERKIKRHRQDDLLKLARNMSNYEKNIRGIQFDDGSRKTPLEHRKKAAFTKAKQLNDYINSCRDVQQPGWYFIQMPDSTYIEVYCEPKLFGGGWTVIQNRFDGSINFYRNWVSYRNAFGFLDGEFWLGLENIYKLTSWRKYELLVYLTDFDGNWKYAKYSSFAIGNATQQYNLKTLGWFSGTAGDSLRYHRGQKFSTLDVDNDQSSANCAVRNHGAWWYKNCDKACCTLGQVGFSNLNGLYEDSDDVKTMKWYSFNNSKEGLATSRMLIREV